MRGDRQGGRMKRIITGVNEAGRSYIISTEELPPLETGRYHRWESNPAMTADWVAAIEPDDVPNGIEPASGASKVIIGQSADDGTSQRGWHTTRTLDYYYVLSGSVTLELDEDSVDVNAGDLVIQQATRHRWKGHGSSPYQFLVVLHRL
jgi:mannose-6-phosphate isomerase-like protein (cupin superfamily)